MEPGDRGSSVEEAWRKLERLELQVELYRRLYRGALEKLKADRRRAGAAASRTDRSRPV